VLLQPLPLEPNHVTRLAYKEFLGERSVGSPESGLFKILDAVATQGCVNFRPTSCIALQALS
jgi:hypothetical protein